MSMRRTLKENLPDAGRNGGRDEKQNEERFVLLGEEGSVIMGSGRVLLVDRETGVTYLLVYGAGVTPLIDADGRPILTPLPKEE